ncbi:MAG: response regulator [Pseudomonadales bacterium]
MSNCQILIADDHPIFRQGVRSIVEDRGEYEIVAEANDGRSAIKQLSFHKPDVAIIDLFMPNLDGFGVLQHAAKEGLATRCIVLTTATEDAFIDEAIALGARGYLFKEDAYDQLANCLRKVIDGRIYISSSMGSAQSLPLQIDQKIIEHLHLLTPTHLQIMRFLSEFKSSKEIANTLNISHRTVQNHRLNICNVLDISGSGKLLEFAVKHETEIAHLTSNLHAN